MLNLWHRILIIFPWDWADVLEDDKDDFLEFLGVFVPSHEVDCLVVIIWVGEEFDDMIDGIDVLLLVFDDVRLAVLEL